MGGVEAVLLRLDIIFFFLSFLFCLFVCLLLFMYIIYVMYIICVCENPRRPFGRPPRDPLD